MIKNYSDALIEDYDNSSELTEASNTIQALIDSLNPEVRQKYLYNVNGKVAIKFSDIGDFCSSAKYNNFTDEDLYGVWQILKRIALSKYNRKGTADISKDWPERIITFIKAYKAELAIQEYLKDLFYFSDGDDHHLFFEGPGEDVPDLIAVDGSGISMEIKPISGKASPNAHKADLIARYSMTKTALNFYVEVNKDKPAEGIKDKEHVLQQLRKLGVPLESGNGTLSLRLPYLYPDTVSTINDCYEWSLMSGHSKAADATIEHHQLIQKAKKQYTRIVSIIPKFLAEAERADLSDKQLNQLNNDLQRFIENADELCRDPELTLKIDWFKDTADHSSKENDK